MIIFWSAWLAVGAALIIVFLYKVPALIIKKIIASAFGDGDYAILTANLQDGASVLCEPSSASSRYLLRYQIYQRNSRRKFFIGEWKGPVDSVEYSLVCYNSNGNLADIIRVNERVGRRRFTSVSELPGSADYVSLRLTKVNGERVRGDAYGKGLYLWLALLILCCAAAACAATCLIYAYLTRVLPEVFNSGWNSVALSAAITFAVALAAYAVIAVWLLLGSAAKPHKQTKKSNARPKNRITYGKIGYVFSSVRNKIGNALQPVLWAFPLRAFTLKKREAEPNARAIRRLKKDGDRR